MPGTVLILGASGRFGRHMSAAFWNAGWTVRQFQRSTDDLAQSAIGTDVIVHGWNPPYTDWAKQVPAMTGQVIGAAKATGATVIVPGNVYVFGEHAAERFSEDAPHSASNPLGRVRIEMEAAFRASGVKTILLRGGDFIDDVASGNWFDKILTKDLQKGRLTYPGALDAPHAWTWLPDFAAAAVMLAEQRDRLSRFEDVPFPGYTLTGRELAAALTECTGRPVHARRMSWLPLWVVRPFWPMARHLLEMRYLWSKPHMLDGTKFKQLLPEFHMTPVGDALALAVKRNVDPDQPMANGAATLGGAAT